jgi:general stress protein 26
MSRSIEEIRQEVWSQLQDSQCAYLATAEADQPRVRPVTRLDLDETFWIATSTRSAKARQMRRNPNVELCLPLHQECGDGYIRISGVATITTDRETIEQIGSRIPFLTEYWEGSNDPDFCLIRITRVEGEYLQPGEATATTFIV